MSSRSNCFERSTGSAESGNSTSTGDTLSGAEAQKISAFAVTSVGVDIGGASTSCRAFSSADCVSARRLTRRCKPPKLISPTITPIARHTRPILTFRPIIWPRSRRHDERRPRLRQSLSREGLQPPSANRDSYADTLEISIATAGSLIDRKPRIAAACETREDPGKSWMSCT